MNSLCMFSINVNIPESLDNDGNQTCPCVINKTTIGHCVPADWSLLVMPSTEDKSHKA